MADEYQYDVFISYRRPNPVGEWVKNHCHPLLVEWLAQAMPYEPEIFIDTESIETSDDWPLKLRQALLGSRCLVTVWSADYFRSAWCMAEWKSMEIWSMIEKAPAWQPGWPVIHPVMQSTVVPVSFPRLQ